MRTVQSQKQLCVILKNILADGKDDEPELIEPDVPKKRQLRRLSGKKVSERSEVFQDALEQLEKEAEGKREEKPQTKKDRFTPAVIEHLWNVKSKVTFLSFAARGSRLNTPAGRGTFA